jgi:hypothetical protein
MAYVTAVHAIAGAPIRVISHDDTRVDGIVSLVPLYDPSDARTKAS